MKAVIPAAGLGTRFLPATKAQPKEMLPVLDRPAIQYVVEEALAAGADEVVVVSSSQKRSIEGHFSPDEGLCALLESAGKGEQAREVRRLGSLPVTFVEQPEPRGLGHAVHCAAAALAADEQPFYVLLGDVLVPECALLPRMLAVSRAHEGASVIAVMRVPPEQVGRFGIVAGEPAGGPGEDGVWRVTGMVEKPSREEAPSDLAIFGRYLLTPLTMRLLATTAPGAGGEVQLTDALIALLAHEEVYALVIGPDEGYDVGTVEDWLSTNLRLARRSPSFASLFDAD
ncbi:MAG: UTP--glucose-1-phosphate uridylyltransferase [Coriobacteriales bacterium]|jgi:UTP--glucose-1-phosphate uridylyltransferase|nr:UTP--glucose-1-phosphate uridylyltransferase [Coriobacteriales bacterium]